MTCQHEYSGKDEMRMAHCEKCGYQPWNDPPDPPECSICRQRHGIEIIHECE